MRAATAGAGAGTAGSRAHRRRKVQAIFNRNSTAQPALTACTAVDTALMFVVPLRLMFLSFTYRRGELYAESVPVRRLAERFGTPLYIYSRNHLRRQYRVLARAMAAVRPLICYSVKANSNREVIRALLAEGAGLDIVSGGELYRSLRAGADPSKIVFAGSAPARSER